MKKVLMVLLMGMLSLSVIVGGTGCAQKNPVTSGANSQESTVKSEVSSDPNIKDLKGDFELALYANGEAREQWWNEVVADFKKVYPNLNIKLSISGTIGDEIRPRWVTNTPPDFCYLQGASSSDVSQLIVEKRFLPLDDFINTAKSWDDSKKLMKDTWSGASSLFDEDGKIIGFPYELGTYGLFYDANLAKKNGWTTMPKTYDELVALGQTVKASGKNIAFLAYPGKTALGYLTNQWLMALLTEKDPDLYLKALGMEKGVWTNPWIIDSYKKIMKLREFEMEGSIGITHTEAQIAWLQGKAFFYPCGTWLEGEMLKDIPDGFDMKMIPYPTMEKSDGNTMTVYVDSNILVPKAAKNIEAALEFARFMYQGKYAKRFAETAKSNFPMKISLDAVNTSSMVKGVAALLIDPNVKIALPKIGGFPVFRAAPKKWFKANQMLMWLGEMTPEAFFKTFEEECEKDRNSADFKPLQNSWITKPVIKK